MGAAPVLWPVCRLPFTNRMVWSFSMPNHAIKKPISTDRDGTKNATIAGQGADILQHIALVDQTLLRRGDIGLLLQVMQWLVRGCAIAITEQTWTRSLKSAMVISLSEISKTNCCPSGAMRTFRVNFPFPLIPEQHQGKVLEVMLRSTPQQGK